MLLTLSTSMFSFEGVWLILILTYQLQAQVMTETVVTSIFTKFDIDCIKKHKNKKDNKKHKNIKYK